MRVLIVGAGISGLVAARGLLAAGHEVTVLERATGLRLGGGAILVWGGGAAVLADLGIGPDGAGQRLTEFEARTAAGRRVFGMEVERAQGDSGAHAAVIRRGDLLLRLAEGLPEGAVRFGARFKDLNDDGDRVRVWTDDGDVHTADLLIGADGVHSAVRAALWGPQRSPVTGAASWQGLVPSPVDLGTRGLVMIGRTGNAGLNPAGGGMAQWFLDVPWPRGTTCDKPLDMLRARYGTWASPIPELLDALSEIELEPYPHHRHKVRRRWGRGRTVLLGDAAHAMPPTLALGANQAMEDVWVLLHRLATAPSTAPQDYARLRRRRAARASALARHSMTVIGPQTIFQSEGQLRIASALCTDRLTTRAMAALHRGISNRL